MITVDYMEWVWLVYKIPYRRAPRLAYRLHRPSASREQRYLAYKGLAADYVMKISILPPRIIPIRQFLI